LVGTAIAVGAATSVTGAVGFVGLIAPHVVRPFVGYQPRSVLLPSALAGALLLLGADVTTRLISFGPEMKLPLMLLLLIIVLLVKPNGLFGQSQTRRV